MSKSEKKQQEKWFYLALTFFLGPAVMGYSAISLNYGGFLLGLALEAWGIWGTPEIHPYLKLIINWKGRKQVVKVERSPEAQVVAAQADKIEIQLRPQSLYAPARPIADATLQYQMDAILQVLTHYGRSTLSNKVTRAQLDGMLKQTILRDGINPLFEPLSLQGVLPALAELERQGVISIRKETIEIHEVT